MNTCAKCGNVLEDGDVFCGSCGARRIMPIKPEPYSGLGDAVRKLLAGDQNAFNYLYEKTYKDKYYITLKYMDNRDDIDEVLQESYTKAYQKLGTLEDPDKFSSWLGMIVANTAKNVLARKKPLLFSQLEGENDEGESMVYEIPDQDISKQPELSYTAEERSEILRQLIGSLSDEQRLCIMMFYIEGLSIKEIAKSLDTNENTVKSRLNYGRKNIKSKAEEMQKKGYNFFGLVPIALLIYLLRGEAYAMGTDLSTLGGVSGAASGVSGVSSEEVLPVAGSNYVAEASSGAAAAGGSFIGTALGKGLLISAIALISAGVTIGTISVISSNRKSYEVSDNSTIEENASEEDSAEEYAQSEDSDTETDTKESTETDEITTEEETEEPTEEAVLDAESAEAMLIKYLEDDLIPEKGINDVLQTYYFRGYGDFIKYEKSYDSSSHEVVSSESYYEYESPEEKPYSYAGICSMLCEDFDGDGLPEMVIICGDESGNLTAEKYIVLGNDPDNAKILLDGKVKINKGINIDQYGGDSKYITKTVIDGEPYLLISGYMDHSDVSLHESFDLISLKDMEYTKGLFVEGPDGQDRPLEEWTLNTTETDYRNNKAEEKTILLMDYTGGTTGLSHSSDYLKSIGFAGEETRVTSLYLGVTDYTGFIEKYYLNPN